MVVIRWIAMTRGRHPVRALEKAGTIAQKRGFVHYYERGPGMLADFSITTPEILAQVRIKRLRYIRCTMNWMEREAAEEIAGLKMFPSSREISRELWICSPEYAWRFYKVCDNGLCELGRDGMLLEQKSPDLKAGTATGTKTPIAAFPILTGDTTTP
ncbi:MAG TPA: hypothetical protein PKM50_01370 [Methanoregula sp.]|nr:hypothetical protein [Methanoregula sp.]